MSIIEVLILAVGLSMDAFAVSVTNGMTKKNVNLKWAVAIAACFGIFQGLMPTIGYFLGSTFTKYVTQFDHYIALILLGFIGGKMLVDAFKKEECDDNTCVLTVGALLLQGVATSIDALAVGVSFAAVMNSMSLAMAAAAIITVTTFAFCLAGVFIGKKFGDMLNNKAQIVGGLILIAIGVKIFVEHVFFS